MNRFAQLDQLIEKNDGTIQTSQVLEAGISKPVFYAYAKEKGLKQVEPYRDPGDSGFTETVR